MSAPTLTRPGPPDASPPPSRREAARGTRQAVGVALGTLSLVLLGVCLQLALVSQVSYERAQQQGRDQLRIDLARGTAVVAQYAVDDPAADESAAVPQPSPTPTAGSVPRVVLPTGGTPIALVSIPALGLEDVVVGEGTTAADLRSGPGHDRMSVMPGQVGTSTVLGRRWAYGAPFTGLPTLAVGSEVRVTTGQGTAVYEVTGRRHPGDPVPARREGEGRLTLVTADGAPFAPTRPVYVDARLTTPAVASSGLLAVPEELRAGPMATDDAWLPLTLWVQVLAAVVLGFAWAWRAWGRRQAWVVGVPLLLVAGMGAADAAARLLPNVL